MLSSVVFVLFVVVFFLPTTPAYYPLYGGLLSVLVNTG